MGPDQLHWSVKRDMGPWEGGIRGEVRICYLLSILNFPLDVICQGHDLLRESVLSLALLLSPLQISRCVAGWLLCIQSFSVSEPACPMVVQYVAFLMYLIVMPAAAPCHGNKQVPHRFVI